MTGFSVRDGIGAAGFEPTTPTTPKWLQIFANHCNDWAGLVVPKDAYLNLYLAQRHGQDGSTSPCQVSGSTGLAATYLANDSLRSPMGQPTLAAAWATLDLPL